MALDIQTESPQTAAAVPMVLFSAGGQRLALEARFVAGMTDTPSSGRSAEASALLFNLPVRAPSTHWLSLHDAAGPWQLGVDQPVTLCALTARELFPLPPLIQARCCHPAPCGIAFEQQAVLVLLDARLLSPQATGN